MKIQLCSQATKNPTAITNILSILENDFTLKIFGEFP